MNQRDAFTNLFSSGYSFEDYMLSVDRDGAKTKMESHIAACEDSFSAFPELLKSSNIPLKILCIAESWCGDCVNAVPILSKLADVQDQWDFKIVKRDGNEEIIDNFYLTAGRKKIPIIIFADKEGDEIIRWIERPNRSYKIMRELKDKRLKKEDYIAEYKSNPELKAPSLTKEITRELLETANRASNMADILPLKKISI